MDLRQAILTEHSKQQTLRIVNYIGRDQSRFDQLMHLFLTDEARITQRAAWALSHCADRQPALFRSHLEAMIDNLQQEGLHDAIKRNSLRILAMQDIPEELQGSLANLCFDHLADPQEKVAIRIYAMQVLYNFCKVEPDLAGELRILIEEHMEHGSAGFRSRGRRILRALDKLKPST
ncbi:MAG: hypothetical protein AAFV25_23245 [Bacteroidota bacterium]